MRPDDFLAYNHQVPQLHLIQKITRTRWLRLSLLCLYLALYLLNGANTELRFIRISPLPANLLADFKFYERALGTALQGGDPYALRVIGPGYLYPPPALLVIELFSHIQPFNLKAAVYILVNAALLVGLAAGVARRYRLSLRQTWYWYPLCLGFAPTLELFHIGQINLITLSGIALLFLLDCSADPEEGRKVNHLPPLSQPKAAGRGARGVRIFLRSLTQNQSVKLFLSALGLALAIVTKVTPCSSWDTWSPCAASRRSQSPWLWSPCCAV